MKVTFTVAKYPGIHRAKVHYGPSWRIPSRFVGIVFGSNVYIDAMEPAVPQDSRLLRHELVHVAQYAKHGMFGYFRRYAWNWLTNGFDYRSLEFEAEARQLEATVKILEVSYA